MLIRLRLFKADAFEYAQKHMIKGNMILYLRIYGMMFLME